MDSITSEHLRDLNTKIGELTSELNFARDVLARAADHGDIGAREYWEVQDSLEAKREQEEAATDLIRATREYDEMIYGGAK